ncbi:ABC transporter substrate-binding protein [Dactylosporangium sp. NPDC000521]|uniref:ABC transporter substrate-binding protein n=1 Tax=Dactylosporangium sp. NPDC000521 TaxID=3363975 RepID=UPI003673D5F9
MTSQHTRRSFLKASALFGSALAAGPLLAACGGGGGSESASGAKGGTLTFGLDSDVPNLQTPQNQGSASMMLNGVLHRGLVQYDAKGDIVAALAEKFETKDSQTFTFTLRGNLKFHDGSPVTVDDVKASLEWMTDASKTPKLYPATKGIDSVTTEGDNTVVVKLKAPDASFLAFLADVSGAILPKKTLGQQAPTYVGAGPFKFVSYEKGLAFNVEKFAGYYEADKVSLDKIQFKILADQAARDNALLTGTVDAISFVGWNDYDRVKQKSDLVLDPTDGPFMYLLFNTAQGPFKDARVRQAVAWAVNRQNVVSSALAGQGSPLAGMPLPESSAFYNAEQADFYKQDVAKAKALLAEAGYANGFKARMLSSSQYDFHQNTAISVQADLKAIGIELEMNLPDWPTRLQLGSKGQYDIAVYGTVGICNDPAFLEQILTPAGSQNASFGYDNIELKALLDKAKQEVDEGKRKDLYKQLGTMVLTEAPIVGLAWRSQAYGHKKSVTGFTNIPGFLTFESGYTLAGTAKS